MATGNDELLNRMTGHVIEQIETRLREADLVSANAKSFAIRGLAERSVETLLGIEPLIFEAKALLEAVTIVRRVRASRSRYGAGPTAFSSLVRPSRSGRSLRDVCRASTSQRRRSSRQHAAI